MRAGVSAGDIVGLPIKARRLMTLRSVTLPPERPASPYAYLAAFLDVSEPSLGTRSLSIIVDAPSFEVSPPSLIDPI